MSLPTPEGLNLDDAEALKEKRRLDGIAELGKWLTYTATCRYPFKSSDLILKAHQSLQNLNHAGGLPAIEDYADWTLEKLPLPTEIIPSLLYRGEKLAIGGGSKTFKTWVLCDLAVSIASGQPWWSFNSNSGRVLYLNFEIQAAFFQRRIDKICETRNISIPSGMLSVWNLRGYAQGYDILIPRVISAIKSEGYSLVILDPIYKLLGEGHSENDAGDMTQMMNSFERIAVQCNTSTAFGAHFSKGNQAAKESIDRMSGSGVLGRDPDAILTMTKLSGEEDSFRIESTLRNVPPIKPFAIGWNYPLMERRPDLDQTDLKQPGDAKTKASCSPDDVFYLIPESGSISHQALLERAIECGYSEHRVRTQIIPLLLEKCRIHIWLTPRPKTNPLKAYSRHPQRHSGDLVS